MATAGYNTRLLLANDKVQFSPSAAVSQSRRNANEYQINNVDRQVLDFEQPITISVGGTPQIVITNGVKSSVTEDWDIDPLFGILTRNASGANPAASTVTVNGSYYNFSNALIGESRNATYLNENNTNDVSHHGVGTVLNDYGLDDYTVNIDVLYSDTNPDFHDIINNKRKVLFEMRPFGTTGNYTLYTNPIPSVYITRGFFIIQSVNTNTDINEASAEAVVLRASGPMGAQIGHSTVNTM